MRTDAGDDMSTDHAGAPAEEQIETYEYSKIEERHGIIPKWLVAVYIVLVIWMAYYLIWFWSP
jgi:hypothetical protein